MHKPLSARTFCPTIITVVWMNQFPGMMHLSTRHRRFNRKLLSQEKKCKFETENETLIVTETYKSPDRFHD